VTPPRPAVFPFFVGSGRSGTTLLRAIFDSHPDVAVPDEVSFVIRLARPHYARRYGWPIRFDAAVAADMVIANRSFRRWGLPEGEVRAALARSAPGSFADLVRECYALWAVHQGKPRYADKTPMHVLHLGRLGRMFPEARFVHLIRDGRDVAASYRSVPWGPTTVEDVAAEWRRRVGHGRRVGRRLGSIRYREVCYEDLVAEPERVVGDLCRFLDLTWDDALLRYHERAEDVIGATAFPSAHQRLLLPPTTGLRDWRRELSASEVARFEAIAGSLLDDLGYQRAGRRPSVIDRARGEGHVVARNAERAGKAVAAGLRVLAGR
jgi:Sulfotransferase family